MGYFDIRILNKCIFKNIFKIYFVGGIMFNILEDIKMNEIGFVFKVVRKERRD